MEPVSSPMNDILVTLCVVDFNVHNAASLLATFIYIDIMTIYRQCDYLWQHYATRGDVHDCNTRNRNTTLSLLNVPQRYQCAVASERLRIVFLNLQWSCITPLIMKPSEVCRLANLWEGYLLSKSLKAMRLSTSLRSFMRTQSWNGHTDPPHRTNVYLFFILIIFKMRKSTQPWLAMYEEIIIKVIFTFTTKSTNNKVNKLWDLISFPLSNLSTF